MLSETARIAFPIFDFFIKKKKIVKSKSETTIITICKGVITAPKISSPLPTWMKPIVFTSAPKKISISDSKIMSRAKLAVSKIRLLAFLFLNSLKTIMFTNNPNNPVKIIVRITENQKFKPSKVKKKYKK